MLFRKIFSGRIDSGSTGAEVSYKLKPSPGGRMCKVAQYMVKTLASSGANVRISISMEQGPDGTVTTNHSHPIVDGQPGTTLPSLLTGDCDTSKIIGEYLTCVIKIKDSVATNPRWANIEVWEMRKPF